MPEYRIYRMDRTAERSSTPPVVVICEDDGEAEHEARKMLDGHALEIWHGPRKVGTIKPTE